MEANSEQQVLQMADTLQNASLEAAVDAYVWSNSDFCPNSNLTQIECLSFFSAMSFRFSAFGSIFWTV